MPFTSVVSVSVFVEFDANVPLAPVAGAVNVTDKPCVGTPPTVTVACSGAPNAAPTEALCVTPPVAVIPTTVPPVVFVRLKSASSVPITADTA